MDTRQIEYILMIAEENNITHAAQRLFLTQPALNQQLLRLEKELGTPLFHRSRTDWRPTEAGLVYLENARKMLLLKQDTYRIIGDMVSAGSGHLSIGFTPGRGIAMFSSVYPEFHKAYPDVSVTPHELSVRKQQAWIARGELDIGFQTLCENQRTSDHYLPICTEEIFLVLPADHPLAAEPRASQLDILAVRQEPFVLTYQESTIRYLTDGIFDQAGFAPNVLFETSSTGTIVTMIRSGLCCGLLPHHYIKDGCDGLAYFALPSHPSWDVVATYRKGSYLSDAAEFFISLARRYWTE